MIESLITSKTRIKLLIKFFLNSKTTAYLRQLEIEFVESTNAIRIELNRLENANLLISKTKGNKKIFQANLNHPLYNDIHSIVIKHLQLDKIIELLVVSELHLNKVFVTGDYALGNTNKWIDLIIIGDQINFSLLANRLRIVEDQIPLKIRYIAIKSSEEEEYVSDREDVFQLWSSFTKK